MKKTTTKIYRNLFIPTVLDEKLKEIASTKIELYKFYHFIYLLSSGFLQDENKNFFQFKPLSRSLLIKIFTTKYYKVTRALKSNDVIECDDIMYKGKCFKYRINPKYFTEKNMVKVKFSYKNRIPLKDFIDNKLETKLFLDNCNILYIPFDKMYDILNQKLNTLSIENYKTNCQIDFEGLRTIRIFKNYSFIKRQMTLGEALKICEIEGKSLIQDKNRLYLMYEYDFLFEKKTYIEWYWQASIENLKEDITIRAKRDKTSKRLHTNFSTLPNELFSAICDENCLLEIDLRNAQPTFLSKLLKEQGLDSLDFLSFEQLTSRGKLYEFFAEQFNMSRDESKLIMFEVFFTSHRYSSPYKDKFKEHFPTVSNWIYNYKKEFGKNALSIKLQSIESNLFIDQIYKPLLEKGIPVFTKHDSISCFLEDSVIVEQYIEKVFRENRVLGELKSNKDILPCAA
jgi:hypothetical protein